MKKVILILQLILINLVVISQTSDEFLKSGIEKQNKLEFKEAIKDYDKAIKKDKNNAFAYYNKGLIELALKDYDNALKDFNKTIQLKPYYLASYYNKASVYVNMSEYEKAIDNLNFLIRRNEKFPNALTLRGQLFLAFDEKEKSCNDFLKAYEVGDSLAISYINKYCDNSIKKRESLSLNWSEEGFQIESNQEDGKMKMIELLKENETLNNWTEIGTMTTLEGLSSTPLDKAMDIMFEQSKISAENPKLTFIEKDENCEYPWIIFKIESKKHNSGDKGPESQLWYIVQGKTSLHTNFRAIKKESISIEIQKEWISFFKKAKIVKEE